MKAVTEAPRNSRRPLELGVFVQAPVIFLAWLAWFLVLLLAPIAIARPRLTPLWLLPVVLWATPHPESLGIVWRIVLVLAVVGLVAIRAVTSEPRLSKWLVSPSRKGAGPSLAPP
jgi:hypothetical protein